MQNGCATGSARDLLVREFQQWKDQNKGTLSLVGDSVCDDGRVCIKLSLGRDKIFSLFCPAEYPEYEDNFFAESESVNHLWLNALNEFILDSDVGLTLEAILWKANSLDSRVRYSPSNSSDEEDENEEFMVLEEEDEEDLMERALWDKEKQWRAKEAKLRASMKEAEESSGPSTSACNGQKDLKLQQVFSNFAASGILTNDLKHIIKSAGETGIDVEPIDSNIYEWSVRFSKFDPNSKLQQDLNLLKELHGVGFIELQLEFTMDLYPFYPPVAKMVRPRPEGSVRFMLACLDILKLSSWNPTCGMITVLQEIKDYLAKHAVLHTESAFQSSILLPIENSLLQLALVSEVMPRDVTAMTKKSAPKFASCSASASSQTSTTSSLSSPSGASVSSVIATGPSLASGKSGTSGTSGTSTSGTMSSSSSTSSTSSTCSLVSDTSKASNSCEDCDKTNQSSSAPSPSATAVYTEDFGSPLFSLTTHAFLKNKVMSALRQHNGKKPKFPDGTGYSTFSDKGWDINAHIAVEKEKDKKIESVLQKILQDLREYLRQYDELVKPVDDSMITDPSDSSEMNDEAMTCNGLPSLPSRSKTVPGTSGQSMSVSDSSNAVAASATPGKEKHHLPNQFDATRQLYEALEASTLVIFMEQKLQVDSFLEICRHKAVYRCVIDILSEIAGRLWLARLLWKQPGQKKSIYSLLMSIKDKAQKVLDRYKLAAESSHAKSEKKGKKRANSGSRDKDKTTRRSKVASASTSSPSLVMDDSEGEAGPSGAVEEEHPVGFIDLHGFDGESFVVDTDEMVSGPDLFEIFPSNPLLTSSLKKGVMTRSAWNLSKGAKSTKQSWSPNSTPSKAGGSAKASSSATKGSTSASATASSNTNSSASAAATKSSACTSKGTSMDTKTPAAGTSKASASTSKSSASTSKASEGTSKPFDGASKVTPGTSKQNGNPSNADGSSASGSAGPSSLCSSAGFYKLKFFNCNKHDGKKGTTSGADASAKDESTTPVGLSGFLSNIGITWPSSWSMVGHEQDPPPIDMSTPLDPAGDEQLAQDFFDLALKVESVIQLLGFPGSDSPEHSDEPLELRRQTGVTSTSEVLDQELASKYISSLREMQFDSCDIDVTNSSSHTYATAFNSSLTPGRAQMMRIAQELASLSTSLPLDLASAIFVRSDDAKITLLKALIIGPEGTPYASGCFLFDIFLPSNYPKSPPKVTLRTTGRGTVRFNPNLYANGKVCLSLLGTWNGLQGEQWNETSTLLQVLVSIQSLIMVAEPYFNEPGYDSMMGTQDGKVASESYNHNVKLHTVRLAMIEMLKYPPPDFEEVVRTHFRIKKRRIMQDIEGYLVLHPTQSQLSKSYKGLKSELSKLKD